MTPPARSSRLGRTARALVLAVGLMFLLTGCPYSNWQETTRELVNDSRANNGRQRLPMSVNVAKKAQAWANHLADCRCLEHSDLAAGMTPGWTAIAENVGYGTPGGNLVSIHRAFMRSGGHRGNILDTRWNVVGTGVAARGTTKYVVHVFARY